MRVARFLHEGAERLGAVVDDTIYSLSPDSDILGVLTLPKVHRDPLEAKGGNRRRTAAVSWSPKVGLAK